MADLKTNIELDDQRFQRAAKRVTRETQTMGKAMDKAIRVDAGASMDQLISKFTTVDYTIQLVMRGLRGVGQAVADYREQFPGLTSNINQVDEATQRWKTSLGRDLALALDSSAGGLGTFIDNTDAMRRSLVDLVAKGFGADVEGVNEANAFAEGVERRAMATQFLAEEERKLARLRRTNLEEEARAAGDVIRAESVRIDIRMQQITDEATAQKAALKEMELSRSAHARAVDLIDQQSQAKRQSAFSQANRALEAEEEKRAEAARKSAEQAERAVAEATRFAGELVANAQRTERDRGAARERLEDARAQRSIEVDMLEGRRREATLAGLQLRFARERREIERDELLGVRQKADALASLARDQEKITGLVMQRTREEERGRAAGIAGGTLGGRRDQAQQLGVRANERTADATASTAADARKVVEQLGRILGVLSVPQGAVFQ